MAEAGFYWCGTLQENDAAACFLCGKELDGWESSDNPWSEHKKHSPQCAFVKLGRVENDLTVSFSQFNISIFIFKSIIHHERERGETRKRTQCSNILFIGCFRLVNSSICWIFTCRKYSTKNWNPP